MLIAERIKHIGLLAQPGGQHQVNDHRQRIEGGPGHLSREFELGARQNRQRVEQVEDGPCLSYGGLTDEFQHHTLNGLPAKRHGNQVTRANFPFHFWGQAIIKYSHDGWNIDSNLSKGGHTI